MVKQKQVTIILILISVLILDQLTKFLTRFYKPIKNGFIDLVFVKNTGSAFGMFQNQNWILTGIAIIFVSVFLFYYHKILEEKDYYAYFLIVAGALGNLIDRIFLGYVTDFFSVGNFPVFNIADSAITIGVSILIFNIVKEFLKKRKIVL